MIFSRVALLSALWGCSVDTSGFGLGFGVRTSDAGGGDTTASDRPFVAMDAGPSGGGTGGAPSASSGGQAGTASGGTTGTGGSAGRGALGGGPAGTGGTTDPGTGGVSPGTGGAQGCGPSTCPGGCCNGNNCLTGNRGNRRCGSGGVACSVCDSCFSCVSGECQLDPGSAWTVTCSSASIEPTRDGVLWDPLAIELPPVLRDILPGDGVRPDPFCELRVDGQAQNRTAVLQDTSNPVWDEAITSPDTVWTAAQLMSPATGWTVFVGDDDGSPRLVQDICEVSPAPTASDFAAGALTFSSQGSCTRLTLQLSCNN